MPERESYEIHALRCMAWERAKGELRSMYHTYWSEDRADHRYEDFRSQVDIFIKEVEDNGLQE